jgi:hypothetical protein
MDSTTNLNLPYIMAAQAQKHVTHNEALLALDALVQLSVLDKDLASPPGSPVNDARYIVAATATGAWTGHEKKIAAYQDGAWIIYTPREGWLAWVADEDKIYVYTGSAWTLFVTGSLNAVVEDPAPQLGGNLDGNGHNIGFDNNTGITDDSGNEQVVFHKTASAVNQVGITNAATGSGPQLTAEGGDTNIDLNLAGKGTGHVKTPLLGVNTGADTTTRFALSAAASLFNHAGNGHQHKINKNASGDTASLLFQTNFSGRAEMGTAGDDDFHVKVSPDGSAWKEAILIDRANGKASFPNTPAGWVLMETYSIPNGTASKTFTLDNNTYVEYLIIAKGVVTASSTRLEPVLRDGSNNNMAWMTNPGANGTQHAGRWTIVPDLSGLGTQFPIWSTVGFSGGTGWADGNGESTSADIAHVLFRAQSGNMNSGTLWFYGRRA